MAAQQTKITKTRIEAAAFNSVAVSVRVYGDETMIAIETVKQAVAAVADSSADDRIHNWLVIGAAINAARDEFQIVSGRSRGPGPDAYRKWLADSEIKTLAGAAARDAAILETRRDELFEARDSGAISCEISHPVNLLKALNKLNAEPSGELQEAPRVEKDESVEIWSDGQPALHLFWDAVPFHNALIRLPRLTAAEQEEAMASFFHAIAGEGKTLTRDDAGNILIVDKKPPADAPFNSCTFEVKITFHKGAHPRPTTA